MRLLCFFFLFNFIFVGSVMANNEKTIYGYVEKVTLLDNELTLSAKLDTGAKSASLNAVSIKEIKVKDKPYLRFIVPSKEGDMQFQCEYVGDVKIKVRKGEQKANPLLSKTIKRPVVLMPVRIADKDRIIRVNLTNRKHFVYPLLLGREAIMAFNGIIDPSLRFTIKT